MSQEAGNYVIVCVLMVYSEFLRAKHLAEIIRAHLDSMKAATVAVHYSLHIRKASSMSQPVVYQGGGDESESARGSTQDYRLGGGILLGPLAANALCILLVLLVVLRNISRERIVGVWC